MDNDDFIRNFGKFIDQHTAASSEINIMDDSIDFKNELRQIEEKLNHYKPMLQSFCNEYENVETKIFDVKQLQRKARFVLDNVQLEEEDLCERFKNLHLNYKTYVKKSGYKDPNEIIHAKINELTTQKRNLMEELVQLRKKADDNAKKLAHAKVLIAEQEEKNAIQIRELKEISETAIPVSPDIKKRIDTVLRNQEINESDGYYDK